MLVAEEEQVHAIILENRHEYFAHVLHPARVGSGIVGIVRSFAVGRMVPECDDPLLRVGLEILPEPVRYGAGGQPARALGVEAHEVNVAHVERVIGLGSGCHAAGFA